MAEVFVTSEALDAADSLGIGDFIRSNVELLSELRFANRVWNQPSIRVNSHRHTLLLNIVDLVRSHVSGLPEIGVAHLVGDQALVWVNSDWHALGLEVLNFVFSDFHLGFEVVLAHFVLHDLVLGVYCYWLASDLEDDGVVEQIALLHKTIPIDSIDDVVSLVQIRFSELVDSKVVWLHQHRHTLRTQLDRLHRGEQQG